jgi:hypothetical protein
MKTAGRGAMEIRIHAAAEYRVLYSQLTTPPRMFCMHSRV